MISNYYLGVYWNFSAVEKSALAIMFQGTSELLASLGAQ